MYIHTYIHAHTQQRMVGEGAAASLSLLPDALIPLAVTVMRRSIISQAGFDIK